MGFLWTVVKGGELLTTSCLDVLVMGGGLAGCVCARELHDRGCKVLLVEKEDDVGGLLKGTALSGYDLDLGPHFFFHVPF